MTRTSRQTLHDAIARNAGLVLSLPVAGMLRHHKSRFLGEAENGFWVQSAAEDAELIEQLIAAGKPAGVSFRSAKVKIIFAAKVLCSQPEFRFNSDMTVPALLMEMPLEVKAVQRRGSYRVRVPADCDLRVRCWRIPRNEHLTDRPMPAQELIAEIRDISLGGLGVIFRGTETEPPKVSVEDRLRIELKYRDAVLLVEGRMRLPIQTLQNGHLRTGILFKALHEDIQGRQKLAQLTKIVGELHRTEVRRCRLGIA